MRAAWVACLAMGLAGCSAAPDPAPVKTGNRAPIKVTDHTAALMQDGLVSSRIVPDHILDAPRLPGGSLGEYEVKGKKYQAFIVDAATNQAAALLLFDFKATLQTPEYISYMGGYFGSDGKQPIYVFAKNQYVAGIAGLPMKEADPLARTLASRLR